MVSATHSIIEEFLRSTEPQVRKNALTALSVVDDEAGAALMAETALSDEDRGVRKRALEEIVSLGDDSRPAAVKLLADALQSEDESRQQRAYFLLGQLRGKGIAVDYARVPLSGGMRLAASMVSRTFLARNWLYRLRGWRYGFWGTLAASGIFLGILLAVAYAESQPIGVVQAAWLMVTESVIVGLGTVLAVFATQFSAPINLQLSRLHGALIELISTFIGSTVGMFLLYILLSSIPGLNKDVSLIIIPMCGLLALVVRFGTICGFWYGRFVKDFKVRNPTRWLEVFYGSATGSLLSVGYYFILRNSYYNYFDGMVVCFGSAAVAVGLANAFAKIDSEGPPE